MAAAIDESYMVAYGVSAEYKDSQNCRLEAMCESTSSILCSPPHRHG